MYSQSCWIHLLSTGWSFCQGWDGERRGGLFPSPLPGGSTIVFPHCLTCQTVGKTKQELVCVGISGKACPSLLMRFTWKWSVTHRASKRQTWAQWGSIHTWLWANCSCIFWFTECGRGRRAELCNTTGSSLPWRWNVDRSLCLHYPAVMRQLLGENIGIAPREGRRRQSAFQWDFWDTVFAEAALSPSSGHQCWSKR